MGKSVSKQKDLKKQKQNKTKTSGGSKTAWLVKELACAC